MRCFSGSCLCLVALRGAIGASFFRLQLAPPNRRQYIAKVPKQLFCTDIQRWNSHSRMPLPICRMQGSAKNENGEGPGEDDNVRDWIYAAEEVRSVRNSHAGNIAHLLVSIPAKARQGAHEARQIVKMAEKVGMLEFATAARAAAVAWELVAEGMEEPEATDFTAFIARRIVAGLKASARASAQAGVPDLAAELESAVMAWTKTAEQMEREELSEGPQVLYSETLPTATNIFLAAMLGVSAGSAAMFAIIYTKPLTLVHWWQQRVALTF
eukprot:gnl/TRDRNA2_/TRDRNA2_42961_c1_seq1.p1 gnl/TRDRNA2_/TRDRNA2_42961_c1~~gnl/TRDRNA2_/TRDRNA2_42961_c1_seq1.p1  ORF type:complete len:269 (+),score=27.56 gnl/TRDRNA2_/TRDRNA2_42961_c1_seq1:58-864(+)